MEVNTISLTPLSDANGWAAYELESTGTKVKYGINSYGNAAIEAWSGTSTGSSVARIDLTTNGTLTIKKGTLKSNGEISWNTEKPIATA